MASRCLATTRISGSAPYASRPAALVELDVKKRELSTPYDLSVVAPGPAGPPAQMGGGDHF